MPDCQALPFQPGCVSAPIESFVGPLPTVTVATAAADVLAPGALVGLGLLSGLYQIYQGVAVAPDEYPSSADPFGLAPYIDYPSILSPPAPILPPLTPVEMPESDLSRVLPPEYTVFGDRFTFYPNEEPGRLPSNAPEQLPAIAFPPFISPAPRISVPPPRISPSPPGTLPLSPAQPSPGTIPSSPAPSPAPGRRVIPKTPPAGEPSTVPGANPFVSPSPAPSPAAQPVPDIFPFPFPSPTSRPLPRGGNRPITASPGNPFLTGSQPGTVPSAQAQPQPQPNPDKAGGDCTCTKTKDEERKKKNGCRQGYFRESLKGITYTTWSTRKCPSSKASSP
jgi:hypothetical protein